MRITPSALAVLAALSLASSADAQSERQHFSIPAPDGPVSVESFGGCARPTCPAVIILSGSKGFGAPAYGDLGRMLSAAGLDAYRVDILSPADLTTIAAASGARARIAFYAGRMPHWTAAVRAVVAELRQRPGHGDEVGVLGISLGAEIAAAAAMGQAGIGALVLVDGGLPTGQVQPTHALPPLLLIWGGADRIFPLSVGRSLEERARKLGGSAAFKVYEGGAHDFFLRTGDAATASAHRDAVDFMAAQLSR